MSILSVPVEMSTSILRILALSELDEAPQMLPLRSVRCACKGLALLGTSIQWENIYSLRLLLVAAGTAAHNSQGRAAAEVSCSPVLHLLSS